MGTNSSYHVFYGNQFFVLAFFLRERLNVGTVPTDKMHPVGTVPTDKMHHVGTVPTNKMHPVGTVPTDKMHPIGTLKLKTG